MPKSLDEIMAGRNSGADPDDASPPSRPDTDTPRNAAETQGQERSEPQIEPQQQPDGDDDEPEADERGSIPLGALQEDRRKRDRRYTEVVEGFRTELANTTKAYEGRINELTQTVQQLTQLLRPQGPQPGQPQQPQSAPMPEIWEDPTAWGQRLVNDATSGLVNRVSRQGEVISHMAAITVHGKEAVDAAYKYLDEKCTNPATGPQYRQVLTALMQSDDPYGNLVTWHQGQPEVQKAQWRAEWEREMANTPRPPAGQPANAAAPANGRAPGPMPSNFAGAPNGTSRSAQQGSGSYRSLQEIMGR